MENRLLWLYGESKLDALADAITSGLDTDTSVIVFFQNTPNPEVDKITNNFYPPIKGLPEWDSMAIDLAPFSRAKSWPF